MPISWKDTPRKLLNQNLALLLVLFGILLVSVSMGPFQNWDTQIEYNAASAIIKWGMPYTNSNGLLINQPPLGFYIEASFLKIFGSSIDTGIVVTTLFGLGCAILTYKIGELFYGKSTGVLAAALFGMTPWHLIMSRSFLIDVQCLFFSLLFLLVGLAAELKKSFRLFAVSGVLFAIAFMTKFYAVFALIPLFLLYVHHKPTGLKRTLSWIGVFFSPVILSALLWYQIFTGQGLLSVLIHDDFVSHNLIGVTPSYFFVANFLLNYAIGWFFAAAAFLSFIICFTWKKLFSKILVFDLVCLLTIAAVVSVNTFLGAGLDLQPPYYSAIKYSYQSLPFFALLAASLAGKSFSLFNSTNSSKKLRKVPLFSLALLGLVLLGLSMFVNMYHTHQYSAWNYLLFRVTWNASVGSSFFNPTPIGGGSFQMGIQYLGFAFVLCGLILQAGLRLVVAKVDVFSRALESNLSSGYSFFDSDVR